MLVDQVASVVHALMLLVRDHVRGVRLAQLIHHVCHVRRIRDAAVHAVVASAGVLDVAAGTTGNASEKIQSPALTWPRSGKKQPSAHTLTHLSLTRRSALPAITRATNI